MKHTPDRHPTPLTEQAAALVAEVERTLAEGQARMRALGVDPQRLRELGARQARADDVAAALHADRSAIEQDVAEAAARLGLGRPADAARGRGHRFV